ncbi:helix-turn-helix transcriptional regulator [Arthrobacter sp. EH-1B-1]|uniref:Helix-turn-helix transcriptional regulator n=1 Tax=Arthrobacter vasquezii TaxID=2977629 RepID=A0ABT6CXL7_9MICC|nr:helix-turn-helix transcriptional regulator [Arthrobacter vasquezii]MDF9278839.1 helix-turn-helix transcriptional regulator [Arthrobacter vasquezii]
MTGAYDIIWNIRQIMATKGLFHTTDLVPLLAERGVSLSREQVYRLVTSTPTRLNLEVLAAFCDILNCTPNDLISFSRADTRTTTTERTASGEIPRMQPIGDLRPTPAIIRRPTH